MVGTAWGWVYFTIAFALCLGATPRAWSTERFGTEGFTRRAWPNDRGGFVGSLLAEWNINAMAFEHSLMSRGESLDSYFARNSHLTYEEAVAHVRQMVQSDPHFARLARIPAPPAGPVPPASVPPTGSVPPVLVPPSGDGPLAPPGQQNPPAQEPLTARSDAPTKGLPADASKRDALPADVAAAKAPLAPPGELLAKLETKGHKNDLDENAAKAREAEERAVARGLASMAPLLPIDGLFPSGDLRTLANREGAGDEEAAERAYQRMVGSIRRAEMVLANPAATVEQIRDAMVDLSRNIPGAGPEIERALRLVSAGSLAAGKDAPGELTATTAAAYGAPGTSGSSGPSKIRSVATYDEAAGEPGLAGMNAVVATTTSGVGSGSTGALFNLRTGKANGLMNNLAQRIVAAFGAATPSRSRAGRATASTALAATQRFRLPAMLAATVGWGSETPAQVWRESSAEELVEEGLWVGIGVLVFAVAGIVLRRRLGLRRLHSTGGRA